MSGPGITNFPDGMIAAGRTKSAVVKGDHIPIGDSEDGNKVKVAPMEAVYNLIAGTPPNTLDTLAKLAAAINNDPNFHSTLTTALAGKAPLASPALTGTPTAPTAAAGTNTTRLATTAFVTGSLAGKAPLASPALTGTPTAPTAAAGTNTTQLATTAFVTGSVAGKAPLASPALTGTPTAPTPAAGTNTNQIANCAFVTGVTAQYQAKWTYSYTGVGGAISASEWTMHAFAASGTLTLPLASSVASGVQVAAIVVAGGAEIVLTRSGSDQFVTPTGLATTYTLRGNGSSIVLVRVTASAWVCIGAPDSLINAAIAPLAPLASPALTGTPTAPTAAVGTNTTQLATTAFVQTALAGAAGVPAGVICMWSGSIATVPTGWALCDGANGTPDLVDRFVVGAGVKSGGDKYDPGDTGGLDSVTLTLTQVPAHTHAGTTGAAGMHNHAAYVPFWGGTAGSSTMIDRRDSAAYNESQPEQLIYTDYSSDHTHGFTTDSKGGGQSHENRPPYYALAFIMKL